MLCSVTLLKVRISLQNWISVRKSHLGLQEDSPHAYMAQLIKSSGQLGLMLSDIHSSPRETVSDRAWTEPSVVEIRLDTTSPVLSDTPYSSPPPSVLAVCQHAGLASPPQPFPSAPPSVFFLTHNLHKIPPNR